MAARPKTDGDLAEVGTERRLTVSRPELLVDGSDRAFRQFVHDTLAFSARIQDVRNRFGQILGLSGTGFTILVSIGHLEGAEGVGVNQVAEHLHLSGAFVTIEVNKLVAAGLVRKVVNPSDRRRVLLTLTMKARKVLDELIPVQQPANDALFGDITAEEFHLLRDIVSRLVSSGDRALTLIDYLAASHMAGPVQGAK